MLWDSRPAGLKKPLSKEASPPSDMLGEKLGINQRIKLGQECRGRDGTTIANPRPPRLFFHFGQLSYFLAFLHFLFFFTSLLHLSAPANVMEAYYKVGVDGILLLRWMAGDVVWERQAADRIQRE